MDADLATLFARALHEDEADASGTDVRILDAALEEFGAHGTRGATIDAIAARAGVGRITVFRRFGTKEALAERVAVRELRRFLAEVEEATAPLADPVDRIVVAFLACVRVATRLPLLARLVREEPGATLETLARGEPSALDLARSFVAVHVAIAQRDAGLEVHRADEIADVLVRLATTYVLVPQGVIDVADEAAARAFAQRVLVPIALGRT
jgi:AcrR family transcriptional regulator